ncbi:hypothetical protein SeMB42_g05695 [Synchytrium endobioticum]|uniref:DUF2062 domain-containing protein n=1 Tax=Synchytrium endobioticum TaxID=286115 RepID=A0A507CPV2_9FUNG|nr:hypothetical protein SeMB42_g05695 [Synchytrium endobioticum]TPX42771.1 hypothetical protein SeLEV6574_g05415 [Synchytrium endobioticum]
MDAAKRNAPLPQRIFAWLKVNLWDRLLAEVKACATPEDLAYATTLGLASGVFPVMGFTSVFILLIGRLFKINIPLAMIISTLCGFIVLPCALFFMRLGSYILGLPTPPLNIFTLIQFDDLRGSAGSIVMTIFCAFLGWSLIMIPACPAIFFGTTYVVKRTRLMSKYKRTV